MILAFGLMPGVPLALLIGLLICREKRYGPRFGIQFGFAVAAWASLCWLVVPYCGVYPNLPGAMIGGALFGLGTWGQEICLHVTNLLLFPLVGRLLFRGGRTS